MLADHSQPREVARRIEGLLESLLESDPDTIARVEELVRLLMQMYGEGLRRIVDEIDAATLRRLGANSIVSGLLVLHDLHPEDIETRIAHALAKIRPVLGSNAGGVEFLGVSDDGVVRVRVEHSGVGCPGSSMSVGSAIEDAILTAAPEARRVQIDGVPAPPRTSGETLVTIGATRGR